ncbi:PD-(D/E)XK nuclease family protein [Rhizobium leguminosarum]|uniref:PDDEXK-like family protein n=1 Tax=Rhizobium leguminosarum TaxID=384 RepID=UPI001D20CCE5|nr:PD-(D/E)XK nuclease family protein [Rhizobium leguminosarum]MBP2442695.1 hypothetical protein [Rhizobium leguminosarum]
MAMNDRKITKFQSISDFVTNFSKMLPGLAAMREGMNLYGATTFSPFSIFDPDENTLSRVIAELFDPSGSHGQGLLFLNGLLSTIGIPRLNRLDTVKVRREVLTRAKRRIDVVIETSHYVIGIENKPWAPQQKNQLGDYLDELKADLRGRKPVLIFLSHQQAQTAVKEAIRVPYYNSEEKAATLYSVLKKLTGEIKASAPKLFVEDFLRYIEIEFGGDYVDTPADKPFIDAVNAEFDDLQRRKAIASVLLSQETLHIRILDEIGDHVLAEVRANVNSDFEASCPFEDVTPKISECLWQKWTPYGLRRPSWPTNCHVAIEAGTGWMNEIIFGVRCPDIDKLYDKDTQLASPGRRSLDNMGASIPGGRKTNYWPRYKYFPERYWGQEFCARLVLESPTGAVRDHPEIQDLARQFVDLASEVDRLLRV